MASMDILYRFTEPKFFLLYQMVSGNAIGYRESELRGMCSLVQREFGPLCNVISCAS